MPDHKHDAPLEYWLDQAQWPETSLALRARIHRELLLAPAARAPFALPAFMIPGADSLASGARGLVMMAVVVGLGAGLLTRGVVGQGTPHLQAPVYAGSGVTLASLYEGDNE